MKKSTIWAIASIMGFSFLALLFLQFSYVEEMVKMKKEQFDESVNRALYQVSHNMEMKAPLSIPISLQWLQTMVLSIPRSS